MEYTTLYLYVGTYRPTYPIHCIFMSAAEYECGSNVYFALSQWEGFAVVPGVPASVIGCYSTSVRGSWVAKHSPLKLGERN